MPPDEGMRPHDEPEASGLDDPRAPWEDLIEDPTAPRRLLAVFFTDIVGSTELATALGDHRWRELLEQHDAAIRAQIARFGGREIDTAGDAFFATFELPIRAVDCALESIRAIRRLGLRIRAGVHMGECVLSNGNVRGVSVHIGARVAAKATGGQLLVSSTVRDILAGAGLKFNDCGEQTLKGVEGRWRLFAVEPRERDTEEDLPPLLEDALKRPTKPLWRQPRVLVAGIVVLAVIIGAITFVSLRGPGGLQSVPADSVALIDAKSMAVVSATKVGARPVGLATTSDGVWVTNSFDRSVSHVSLDGRSVTTITGLGASPSSDAIAGNLVWIANIDGKTFSRVSPQTKDQVGSPIPSGNGLSDVAYGAGAIWATNSIDGTVWRIDPASGSRTSVIPVGPSTRGIAVTKDAVWVASEVGQTVSKIDPGSRSVVAVVPVGHGPRAVAVGSGAVWVANAFDGTVSRIDAASNSVVATIRVGSEPRAISVAAGRVFVANEGDASVSVIDPKTNREIHTIPLHNAPMALAAEGDRVWVSVRGGAAAYRGGTLRMGTAINDNDYTVQNAVSFDPAYGFPEFNFALTPGMYDGLVTFKKTGGVEGNEVVPDLAVDLRPPTDGGTTYSFTLRKGLKYSDGTPVRAGDVRHSVERVFLKKQNYPSFLYVVIEGADKCTPKRCDLSKGIVTDDAAGTIVFHLKQPFADFPQLLALPWVGVVPSSTPDKDMSLTPVPGTGPYVLSTSSGNIRTGGQATLKRNPNFVPRGIAQPGGYPNQIVVTWGHDSDYWIQEVKDGREDFTIDTENVDFDKLAVQTPGQLHIFDLPSIVYAAFDLHDPPFNDIRARRALNLAIDRDAIAAAIGGPLHASSTCQVLPKNLIGYVPTCPYTLRPNLAGTWNGPDVATARTLVAATKTAGTPVSIWLAEDAAPYRHRIANVLVQTLRSIGYPANIETYHGDLYGDLASGKVKHLQIVTAGWQVDYPGVSSFFVPLLTCPRTLDRLLAANAGFNLDGFCDTAIDQKMEHALDVQRSDVETAGDLWAEIDRDVLAQAPWVPLGNLRAPVYVSSRIGNVLFNSTLGLIVGQMWVTQPGGA